MANDELKKLIADSFLSDEEKKYLDQYLELKGVDDRLFELFNEYLIKATRTRSADYKKLVAEVGHLSDELDSKITSEKKKIEDEFEKKISKTEKKDVDSQSSLWDEYYKNLDNLGERYKSGLKQILSQISSKLV